MQGGLGKLLGALGLVGLIFAARFGWKWKESRDARKLMYERYADLGEPDEVKAAVDRHHDELFDASYTMRRRKDEFDAERYVREMDRRVEGDLQRSSTAARLAELAERAQRAASPPRAAAPAPTPPPGHRVEIMTMTVRVPGPGDPAASPVPESRQFVVEVLVSDEADDITPDRPPMREVGFVCADGSLSTEVSSGTAQVRSMGTGKALLSLPISIPAAKLGAGGCELLLSVTDRSGNKAPQQRAGIPG
jgi:hypothetical protein